MTEDSKSSAAILDMVQQHEGYVRALARALLDDEHAVDDVVQQAWLRAIESPPRESGVGPVRSWLRTVMQNLISSEARSRGARRHREKIAFEVGLCAATFAVAMTSVATVAVGPELVRGPSTAPRRHGWHHDEQWL